MDYKWNVIQIFVISISLLLSIISLYNCENSTIRGQNQLYFPNQYKARPLGCDTTLTKREGWIYSPNFPNNYDNYLHCNYKIVKSDDDVCSIELTITDFDVEETPECSGDYLDLGDGSRRMCGVLIADTRKIITFPTNGDNIKITFKSNYYNNRKGFMAKVRQLANSCPAYVINRIPTHGSEPRPEVFHRQPVYLGSYCDIYIGEVIGDLRSPGYPYGYHNNQSCVYSIRRAATDICKVELIFHQFDISSNGRRCDSDFVELPDKSRLCGKVPHQQRVYPFSRSSDFLILKFNSDLNIDRQVTGFWIEIRQMRNSCDMTTPQNALKCDQSISGQISSIHSPNYPQFYGSSQQCVYLVEPMDRNTCEYQLEFLNFNIESSRDYMGNCHKDFFQLPDGNRICGYFSGIKTFNFAKYRDRIGMFYFNSDEKQEERGFEVRVNQIPNSCFHNHNHGFSVKPSYETSTPSPYLTTPYMPTNNTLYNCDQIISREIEIISSPNYPQNYPTTTRCIYTFLKSVPNVCQIRVKILDMDLENTRGCISDYLEIEPTGQRFCGQFLKPEDKIISYPSFSHELRLIFNSDRQTTRPGFRLRAEQILNSCTHPVIDQKSIIGNPVIEEIPIDSVIIGKPVNPVIYERPTNSPVNTIKPLPQICSTSSAIVSTFQSDNYPLAYNAFTNCVYKVIRASRQVCRLEVHFEDFDVGVEDFNHKYCTNGWVEFNGIKYCGRRKGERFTVDFGPEKQEMTIRFHTESAVRYGGFRIRVRQVDDNCHQNSIQHEFSPGSTESCNKMHFSEKSLQILSPHYESGSYQPFLDCEYVVKKSTFDVCALEVKFDAFSLEESKNCYKDYLQIGSMKLCGKLPYMATRTYEFTTDEIVIKFHTDSDISDAGFVILVKQIQC